MGIICPLHPAENPIASTLRLGILIRSLLVLASNAWHDSSPGFFCPIKDIQIALIRI